MMLHCSKNCLSTAKGMLLQIRSQAVEAPVSFTIALLSFFIQKDSLRSKSVIVAKSTIKTMRKPRRFDPGILPCFLNLNGPVASSLKCLLPFLSSLYNILFSVVWLVLVQIDHVHGELKCTTQTSTRVGWQAQQARSAICPSNIFLLIVNDH